MRKIFKNRGCLCKSICLICKQKALACGPERKGDIYTMIIIPGIFQSVKGLTFTEVLLLVYGEQPDLGGKIICVFHDDDNPSFQVNSNYGYCYGCGWRGDIIAYVSERENIRPIDAAISIAHKFNLPVDWPPTQHELQKITKMKRNRNIAKQYHELEKTAFLNLADFRSRVIEIVRLCGFEIKPATVEAVHMMPIIEEYMMILSTGAPEERLQLLREGVLTRWANLS